MHNAFNTIPCSDFFFQCSQAINKVVNTDSICLWVGLGNWFGQSASHGLITGAEPLQLRAPGHSFTNHPLTPSVLIRALALSATPFVALRRTQKIYDYGATIKKFRLSHTSASPQLRPAWNSPTPQSSPHSKSKYCVKNKAKWANGGAQAVRVPSPSESGLQPALWID